MNWLCLIGLCSTLSGPAKATDGDTLRIDGIAIRLEGIDAPELFEPYGAEALYTIRDLIATRVITCRLTGAKSYAREVGRCYSSSRTEINSEMVRLGAALDCARYSGGRYRGLEPKDARQRLKQKSYC